jgi:hypothetical protein
MDIRGVGGVQMKFLGRIGWGYGKISGGVERDFSSQTRFEAGDNF